MREPERIVRLRTVIARTGLSRSTIYRKIAEGTFRPSSKSAPTARAGMNPTSTVGSPIPYHGARNGSSTSPVKSNAYALERRHSR